MAAGFIEVPLVGNYITAGGKRDTKTQLLNVGCIVSIVAMGAECHIKLTDGALIKTGASYADVRSRLQAATGEGTA